MVFEIDTMKKTIIIAVLVPLFFGCAAMDRLVLHDPPPTTNEQTGEVVDPPPQVKPEIEAAIQLAGDVVPVPWAGMAANGLLLALTAYGSIRGRKWKKAAVSAVRAGNEFRQVIKAVAPDKYQDVKSRVIGNQDSDGTRKIIKTVLNEIA